MRSIGLDLGKKTSLCQVLDGKVVHRATLEDDASWQRAFGPGTVPAHVLLEACREAWFVIDRLEAWGHKVTLLDTTRARQLGIGQHKRKTDKIDAEVLAKAIEKGAVPSAHVLSHARQQLRHLLSVRRCLVEARAQHIVTLRGVLRAQGVRVPSCAAEHILDALAKVTLTAEQATTVAPLRTTLVTLMTEVARAEHALAEACARDAMITTLATAPGVGLIVAATFVSVLDEAKRFANAHQVAAYLGLVPSENTSGRRRLGSITKQGNAYARAMLVEAAWTVLNSPHDTPLTLWAKQVAKRRGAKIAAVAVARRLSGILWAMWRDDTVYEPVRVSASSARGLDAHAQDATHRAAQLRRAATKLVRKKPSARAAARPVSA